MQVNKKQHRSIPLGLHVIGVLLLVVWGNCKLPAQESRAEPPSFDKNQVASVFYSKLSDAIRGKRPVIGERRVDAVSSSPKAQPATTQKSGDSMWGDKIDAISLEDEIKRIRGRFDQSVTTPAAFRSGGYQDASLNLTILATLFAVVSEFESEVRWKSDAAAARDVMARSARNAQSGSIQVFNEVKKRMADLQDLLSGAGLPSGAASDAENDWALIADRTPLMEYAEELLDSLSGLTRDEATTRDKAEVAARHADLLTMLGVVIGREGMDDADDPDYVAHCDSMTDSARKVKAAIRQERYSDVRALVGSVSQSCARCHEDYR